MSKPEVHAWFVGAEVADDDPLAAVKRRAQWHCDPFRHVAELTQWAGLVGDESFSADEVKDMGLAAGLSGDELDAAANVAVALWEVEQQGKI